MRYRLSFAIAPRQLESITSRTTDHISSQKSTLARFVDAWASTPRPESSKVLQGNKNGEAHR
jgi:hypothetical protein